MKFIGKEPESKKDTLDRFHRGSNQSGMRDYNERLVLTLLRRHGALSKTDIAKKTGLSAQTVSVIMRQLERDGLIQRGEPTRVRGKVGQPSIPMSLAPDGAYFLGLKVGRRSGDLILIDFLGTVLDSIHHTYAYPTPQNTIRFTREAIARITGTLSAAQQDKIAGLGVGIPFQLWEWGETISAPQAMMDAWRGVDIRTEIEADCAYPVYLQNDATAACAAELVIGQGAGPRDFVYFYLGYFIGGGIVLNGSLYSGRTGNAGALGSMPVPGENGAIRQLIDVASVAVLERTIRCAGGDPSSLWESPTQWHVDACLLDEWIDATGRGIAHAIATSISVIDFETVMIDGWLPLAVREAIVTATCHHLRGMNFSGLVAPKVREGTIGYNARALGAASLPLSMRFLIDQNALLKAH